jgi:hypothetical protein
MQDDTLSGVVSSVDVATTKNLDDLVKVGEELLKKPVSRVNLETGLCKVADQETNEEAIKRYQTIKFNTFLFNLQSFILIIQSI